MRDNLSKISRRDFWIGVIVLVPLVVGGILFLNNKKISDKIGVTPSPIAKIEREKILESVFKKEIPEDIEKTDLLDISNTGVVGIATRNEILADLPDPEEDKFYQGWLEKDGKIISLGKLRMIKGGWLVEYDSSKYSGYNKVIVSLETKFDSTVETKILEGAF